MIDQIVAFFEGVLELARGGFDTVNQIMGLVIALIAAILMKGWNRLVAIAAGATLVHLLIQTLMPLINGGSLSLPDVLSLTFWQTFVALLLGYLVVIAIFFAIKRYVLRAN